MVKAVAVLGSNEGVSGTIYFAQEGDGNVEVVCLSTGWLLLLFNFY